MKKLIFLLLVILALCYKDNIHEFIDPSYTAQPPVAPVDNSTKTEPTMVESVTQWLVDHTPKK